MIVQWGTTGAIATGNNNTGSTSLVFPISFPSSIFSIVGNAFRASHIGTATPVTVVFNNIANGSCYWQITSPNNGCNSTAFNVKWIAIGY